MMVFQCPDCYELHEEPLEATYALNVRCAPCLLSQATVPQIRGGLEPEALDAAWASVTRTQIPPVLRGRQAA
ncbi:MAG TPA: hypothetical protein VME66_08485 [Candidatus Acidoferrales bacterium]|nr:hypothetical protein [Candidatus Acidoferrales bacterium]